MDPLDSPDHVRDSRQVAFIVMCFLSNLRMLLKRDAVECRASGGVGRRGAGGGCKVSLRSLGISSVINQFLTF